MNFNGYGNNQQQRYSGGYGGNSNCPKPMAMSTTRLNPAENYTTYGRAKTQSGQVNRCGPQMTYGYQPNPTMAKPRQQVGRNSCRSACRPANSQMIQPMTYPSEQRTQQTRSSPAAQNPYACQPGLAQTPVMVNVSAATLASAKNTSSDPSRAQCGVEDDGNVKYIPLNWEDILGKTGFNGMQVSMIPSNDPSNPNRQLKVSFGGGQAGGGQPGQTQGSNETPLKVVSFQPLTSGLQPPLNSKYNPNDGREAAAASAMNYTVAGQQQQWGQGQQMKQQQQPKMMCNCPNCRGSVRV